MRTLIWFRQDLRLNDNIALSHAFNHAEELLAVFLMTPVTWRTHDAAACKVQFILENLRSLSQALWKNGIPLLILQAETFEACPALLLELCEQYHIDALYFNKQYEIDERKRDQMVETLFQNKIKLFAYDDQCVMCPGSVLNQKNEPFKIFTPFKKKWLHEVNNTRAWYPASLPQKIFQKKVNPDPIPTALKEFNNKIDMTQWPAGETAAKKKLMLFCEQKLSNYKEHRDFPALSGTSALSPYLAQGVLSPRQCIAAVMQTTGKDVLTELDSTSGPGAWINELIWREFYKHVMHFFSHVCKGQAFIDKANDIPWWRDDMKFNAWCEGMTGFPLVDAAMRQLNQTGWMHNRLRMVVAMFLTKTLFLDWHLGEKYFMQHLIDGDFAANNGGWQWSSSTGTDSVPYFRIFNPITQSERFDKDGKFIRQYCPELSGLDNKTIHDPFRRGIRSNQLSYPLPIVDYSQMRKYVINIFKNN